MMKQTDDEVGILFQATNPTPCVLQQRRVRDITSIAIRNLTISLRSFSEDGTNDDSNNHEVYIYFSLHIQRSISGLNSPCDGTVFKSEKLKYTSNPTWSGFKIPAENSNASDITVRLWIEQNGSSLPALQYDITLSQLVYVGNTLFDDKLAFHSNTVVVRINGWFYTSQMSLNVGEDFKASIFSMADFVDVRNSYSLSAFKQILLHQEMISKKKKSLFEARNIIEQRRKLKAPATSLKIKLENLQNKINHLRQLLDRESKMQVLENQAAEKKKTQLNNLKSELTVKQDELEVDRQKHREAYDSYIATREKIALSGTQLGNRRKTILSELSQIFPISKVVKIKTENASDLYSICGAILPDAEHLSSRDDQQTSVALDFTAQLLSMMSQFLLIPLRYPLTHKRAHLMILDHVTEKLSEKERLFPLFVKGSKDRFLFEYGVFLLNKNVAQLRYYFGMGTSDLRLTLKNIHSLLVERLGAKSIFHSNPITVTGGQHIPQLLGATSNSTTENGSLSLAPNILPSLKAPDTPQHQLIKIKSKEASPRKVLQRVEHRNTELSSLRGELFGTGNPQPTAIPAEKSLELFVGRSEMDKETSVIDYRSDINKDSIDSIASNDKPHRSLTGLEEIDQSKTPKSETRSAKQKHAHARAQLLGKSSAGWGKRSNSSASSDSTRSNPESRDRGTSWVDDVTTEVLPRSEGLPYMSSISSKIPVNGTRDTDEKGGDVYDHVTTVDQSEDIDLC